MATRPEPDLARVADLMGEPSRGAMLAALLGGEWLPAGELAARAGVAASTASEHLARLVQEGLVVRRVSGRHRYFALAGEEVASALEGLARIAPMPSPGPARRPADRALCFARTCYDHLAGEVAVGLAGALVDQNLVTNRMHEVTPRGEEWMGTLGIDVQALRRERRALVRPCLDWSERRDHLAGAVGAAITTAVLDRGWVVRLPGTRALRLTLRGREALHRALGLRLESTGP